MTDIAAEDLAAHALHEFGRDGPLVLDGEIGDAAGGVHAIRHGERVGGAGFNAAAAGAAVVGHQGGGRFRVLDGQIGEQDGEKCP